MENLILVFVATVVCQVTTSPIGKNQIPASQGFMEEPINSEELQLKNLNPDTLSSPDAIKSYSPPKDKTNINSEVGHIKDPGLNKSPTTFTEEDLEEGFDTILKDVLLTLRDHPEIVREILQEEGYGPVKPKQSYFEKIPPQLALEPKRVEKKGHWKQYVPKFNEDKSDESEENQYKIKYGTKSSKSSKESNESEERDDSSLDKSDSNESQSDSSESSSSSQSDSSSQENKPITAIKREPETLEPTIDMTFADPTEGGLDDPVNAGTRKRNGHALPQRVLPVSQITQQLKDNYKNPFLNPLPIISSSDFQKYLSQETAQPRLNSGSEIPQETIDDEIDDLHDDTAAEVTSEEDNEDNHNDENDEDDLSDLNSKTK